MVCSATEHHAVLGPVAARRGDLLAVGPDGRIDLAALAHELSADRSVSLLSVMTANNEVGTIQPIAEIVELVAHLSPATVIHTDAVAAAPWLDLRHHAGPAHLISVSAHKVGGPQGIGALVVREGTPLAPQLLGGGQERERRTGTPNLAGAVGFAAALAATARDRAATVARVESLRDRLVAGLLAAVPDLVLVSPEAPGAPHAGHGPRLLRRGGARGTGVPAGPGRRGRLVGIELLQRRVGAVARAHGHGRASRAGPGRFASRSGGAAPTPTSTTCSPWCPAPWPRPRHRPRPRPPGGRAPLKVLVMMSGGVDSSVAAALLRDQGHDVVGVTHKLWGGESDSGCCSISDVDDARRVADHLGIDHHTVNFGDAFTEHVVAPYSADHAAGRTPNPCIECNRHIKFDAVYDRAALLGFDAVATGHHAQVALRVPTAPGGWPAGPIRPRTRATCCTCSIRTAWPAPCCPSAVCTKAEVRALAAAAGLRTAAKPDSQDVCFITRTQGRGSFLGERIPLTPARVIDGHGATVGRVPAVELVTLGQRKGLGLAGGTDPQYVVDIDRQAATVTVGSPAELVTATQPVAGWAWAAAPETGELLVQVSAHGRPHAAAVDVDASAGGGAVVRWTEPQRRVAPGQSVVAYVGDHVVGGGTAT